MTAAEKWNGNVLGGERPRNEGDAYFTPDALALAIAARVRETFGEFHPIVEPNAGRGAFVRAARAVWPGAGIYAIEPHATDHALGPDGAATVVRQPWEWSGFDRDKGGFFCQSGGRFLVIGNPPYNLPGDGRGGNATTAERHVLLALDRMRDGDVLAFLLRLAFLGGGGRIERLYEPHPLAALWPVTPRPSFTGGGTDASEYGVFVWRKGYRGPVDMRALAWRGS